MAADRTNWIWAIPPTERRVPFANYDHEESDIPSYEVRSIRPIVQLSAAEIVLLMSNVTSARLNGMHYLPSFNRTPLIDSLLQEIIARFAGNDIQFMPVTVRTKDAMVTRYSYARPLLELPCTDLEKSDIVSWTVPGKKIMDARLLVFKPDCLGDRHFARDSYTSHVVVSDTLKEALEVTSDKGLTFRQPEDMWNIFKGS